MKYDNCYIKLNDKGKVLNRLLDLGFKMSYDTMMELPYTAAYITKDIVLGVLGDISNYNLITIDDLLDKDQLVFSINEKWTDDVDYICDCLEDEEIETIKVGIKVPIYHKDLINLRYLTEQMEEYAYDMAEEYSESYLKDLTTEKAKELEELIINWLNKNVKQPTFYQVKGEKEIIKRPYICKCNHIECICPESKDETRFRINEC